MTILALILATLLGTCGFTLLVTYFIRYGNNRDIDFWHLPLAILLMLLAVTIWSLS